MGTHHKYGGSSLQALKTCSHYVGTKIGNKYASDGTDAHKEVLDIVTGKQISSDDKDVEWGANEIKNIIASKGYDYITAPKLAEQKVSIIDEDFNGIAEGTYDLSVLDTLFEIKRFVDGDYLLQTTEYALGIMQRDGLQEIDVYEVILMERKVNNYKIGFAEAQTRIESTIKQIEADLHDNRPPSHGPQCRYCAKLIACEAVYKNSLLENVTVTDILDPTKIGELLDYTKVLSKWIEIVELHAKMQSDAGNVPAGYVYKEVKGRSEVTDIEKLFELSGLSKADFYRCCKINLTNFKLYAKNKTTPKEVEKMISVCSTEGQKSFRLQRVGKRDSEYGQKL